MKRKFINPEQEYSSNYLKKEIASQIRIPSNNPRLSCRITTIFSFPTNIRFFPTTRAPLFYLNLKLKEILNVLYYFLF